MASDTFDEDGLAQARKLIDDLEASLPRRLGMSGEVIGDEQTQKVLRILRILTDQIEALRVAD